MSASPAFQAYPDEWLASTSVILMTPAEEGAYWRLLCYEWNDPECTLPDDDSILAILSRLGAEWHNGAGKKIRACFKEHATLKGRIFNERLMKERKKQEDWRKKSRSGGKKSAELRKQKSLQSNSLVDSSSTTLEPHLENGSNQKPTLQSAVCSLQTVVNTPPPPADAGGKRAAKKRKGANAPIEYPLLFEMFWDHYPRHDSKKATYEAFQKIDPIPDVDLINRMIAAIAEQAKKWDWTAERVRYIPQATTWLNQRRWEQDNGELPLQQKNQTWGKKKNYGAN